jgi:hypothetical protein
MPRPSTEPTPVLPSPGPRAIDLETALHAVETHLAALGTALKLQDPVATEASAGELHRALAHAVDRFAQAARKGGVPPALRRRLALTGGQVAAQRDAVSRASSALDRVIDVLMPEARAQDVSGYGAHGAAQRAYNGGVAQA